MRGVGRVPVERFGGCTIWAEPRQSLRGAVLGKSPVYRRSQLENGIRIVTEHLPCSKSVSLGVLVNAGPQDDPPQKSGLAHLAEHCLFQGTSGRDALEIARLMDVAGGQMGAFTTRDYTCFFANVLAEYLPYATDLFSDMLLNSVFPPENVEREKQAILREIDLQRDTPAERVHHQLKRMIWPDHALGSVVQGNADAVRRITADEIRTFVRDHYTPDRLIVAAAGNVDHESLVEQIRDGFWRLTGATGTRPTNRCQFHAGIACDRAPVSQAYFAIGIEAPIYTSAERYEMFLLNSVLGGGLSSRLYRKLREQRGLVYDISSELHAYRDAGVWVIQGSTAPEHLQTVIALTTLELQHLATFERPIDEEELWTAKMQVRGQHLLAAEEPFTRMSRLATQELYFGRHLPEDEILSSTAAVTVDDLRATSHRQLRPALRRLGLSTVGPEASASYSPEALKELLNDLVCCAV